MKTKTRHSVFETNSSSTHSISISENIDGLLDTIVLDCNGNVVLSGGEFGWEIRTYNDALTKANYLLVYAMTCASSKPEYEDVLIKVIKDQTGCKEVVYDVQLYNDELDFGYIDHQSTEDGQLDYLFEDENLMRQFIFNPQSTLETDNDNHI